MATGDLHDQAPRYRRRGGGRQPAFRSRPRPSRRSTSCSTGCRAATTRPTTTPRRWAGTQQAGIDLQPRARQGLGAGHAARRRRRHAHRPGRHGRRAGRQGQGRRHGGGVQRLRQLAAGHVLAEELGHHRREGLPGQEDRQPRGRRRARDVAGAGQGQRHRPEVGDLGEHRRQCQAGVAEGQVDRRDHLVLQHPPHLPARTGRRHGLPGLARRGPQPLRQLDHRQRQVPGREQGRWSTSSSRSRSAPLPPA